MNNYTVGALFAGMGGLCAGFKNNGFQTAWACDVNESCKEIYQLNFGSSCRQQRFGVDGDVRKLKATGSERLVPVDILHAGFPCQSFSVAGSRSGFDDPKGNGKLMFEIFRLIREWNEHNATQKPRILLFENTPNFQIGKSGEWFRTFSHELSKHGYWFSSKNTFELDTQNDFGLVQQRKRIFMFAVDRNRYRGNRLRPILEEVRTPQKLSDLLESDVPEKYYLPPQNRYYKEIISKWVEGEDTVIYQYRKYRVRKQRANHCPTLPANMGKGGHNVPFIVEKDKRIRKLTERECLRLQGFDDKFIVPSSLLGAELYHMIGNSVSPQVSFCLAKSIKQFFEDDYIGKVAV